MVIHADAYIHPNAIVEDGATIGARTKVWAFTHVLPGAVIGEDCNLNDHVFIENDVCIGNRVTLKSGVKLWDGVTLEDDVFIGPSAAFTNDRFPRSKHYPDSFSRTLIREKASIGANATLLPGLTIGVEAMVGAGAVVTKDVPPRAIVIGNPAYIKGYLNASVLHHAEETLGTTQLTELNVNGVQIITLPEIVDLRGKLTYAELGLGLPFEPKRYFVVYGVPTREVRGEHAHHSLHQFLICVSGEVSVVVDDGKTSQEIRLSRPNEGLYIPPMVWAIQYRYTQNAVLFVLASDKYEAGDYIRDYAEFLRLIREADLES